MIPISLRRVIVESYESGNSGSFLKTASLFNVGVASVNRLMRLKRETGDIVPDLSTRGRRRKLDLEWLRLNAEAFPDKTRRERALDWEKESGKTVSESAIGRGLRFIGWSYKKKDANGS